MKISEIMTRHVLSVQPEATIADAAQLMLRHRISGLPVVDQGGAVVGVISEGDLLRRAETGTERRRPRWLEFIVGAGRLADDYVAAHARRVTEVMSENVASVSPQDDVAEAVRLMERRNVKRLPVIKNGKVVGIVSRANLVRALVHSLAQVPSPALESDAAIRDRILAGIENEPWGPRFSVSITVTDGVAEFYGSITDERERNALRVLAENVPGVKEVHDHLVWVEPVSGFVIDDAGLKRPPDAA